MPAELTDAADSGDRDAAYVMLALEDEVYNNGKLSATLASAYLKQHFGYGGGDRHVVDPGGRISLSFEHDIGEDGI